MAVSISGDTRADAGPAEAEVRKQLARIRTSPDFDVPDRLRKFLAYIVEETLAGRCDRIKAYSIATDVFERAADFDAQNDPIVRIEARRLRLALERYYLTAGHDDGIGIAIPKGSYAPVFSFRRPLEDAAPPVPAAEADPPAARPRRRAPTAWRTWVPAGLIAAALLYWLLAPTKPPVQPPEPGSRAEARAPDTPKLLIGPFEDLAGNRDSGMIARGLTEELISQIALFRELTVVTNPPPVMLDGDAFSGEQAPRYRLEGGVRTADDRLRLTARLVDVDDGSVLWSDIYDEKLDVRNVVDLQAALARDVVRAVAQPYGIIFRSEDLPSPDAPATDWLAYECTLAYYSYRVELTPAAHAAVQDCLRQTTQRFPGYATGWALLSITYTDEARYRYSVQASRSAPIPAAIAAAERALETDPRNVRGHEAMMIALFLSGKVDEALKTGARGYAINPNDMEFMGEYGNRLALSGRWQEGCAMLSEARMTSAAPAGYIEVNLAVCSYMAGDYAAAETWITAAPRTANPVYQLVAAAVAGQRGKRQDADAARDWLEANAPDMLQNVRREVAMRIVQPADQAHFLDGLRKGGFLIPES